ncbi:hypothetical protein JCM2811A_19130 [Methylorubrum rhodinum]
MAGRDPALLEPHRLDPPPLAAVRCREGRAVKGLLESGHDLGLKELLGLGAGHGTLPIGRSASAIASIIP